MAVHPTVPYVGLAQILSDPAVRRMSAARLVKGAQGEARLRAFEAAKLGALIGTHHDPDEDALFTALGTAAALQGDLPRTASDAAQVTFGGRPVAPHLQKWLEGVHFSRAINGPVRPTTLAVDCALPNLLQGVAEGMNTSQSVLVLDHHEVPATRAALNVGAGADFVTWCDPHADAASILAAALAARAGALTPLSAELFLRGILWDTHDLQNPGTNDVTRRVAKDLALQLPPARREAVLQDVRLELSPARPSLEHKLVLDQEVVDNEALFLGCSFLHARETYRQNPERPSSDELKTHLLNELDYCWRNMDYKLVVLVRQVSDTDFHVSCRSREDGPAFALAKNFYGGGHGRRAAAQLRETHYAAVRTEVLKLLGRESIRSATLP